jgi:2-dehydro-3-deoxyphosphogalactonate aldolase
MLVCAGCATATEAFSALDAGAQWLKIFPSSTFGPDYIRALKAVLPPEVPVLAVGGVTPENLATWVAGGVRRGRSGQRSLSRRTGRGTYPRAGGEVYRRQ